jgi:hypothetical protein
MHSGLSSPSCCRVDQDRQTAAKLGKLDQSVILAAC